MAQLTAQSIAHSWVRPQFPDLLLYLAAGLHLALVAAAIPAVQGSIADGWPYVLLTFAITCLLIIILTIAGARQRGAYRYACWCFAASYSIGVLTAIAMVQRFITDPTTPATAPLLIALPLMLLCITVGTILHLPPLLRKPFPLIRMFLECWILALSVYMGGVLLIPYVIAWQWTPELQFAWFRIAYSSGSLVSALTSYLRFGRFRGPYVTCSITAIGIVILADITTLLTTLYAPVHLQLTLLPYAIYSCAHLLDTAGKHWNVRQPIHWQPLPPYTQRVMQWLLHVPRLVLLVFGLLMLWFHTVPSVLGLVILGIVVIVREIVVDHELSTALNDQTRLTREVEDAHQHLLSLQQAQLQHAHLIRFLHHEVMHDTKDIVRLLPYMRARAVGQTTQDDLAELEYCATHLHDLSHNLLLLTQRTPTPIHHRPVALAALVNEVREMFTRTGPYDTHTIEVAADATLSVMADPTYLRLALRTAIRNALDALDATGETPRPALVVRAQTGPDGDTVMIEIEDWGSGFPLALLLDLNERIQQQRELVVQSSGKAGGFGLGIALMHKVVQLHGGHLLLANAATHRGAHVTFVLPRRVPARHAPSLWHLSHPTAD